MKMKPPHTHLRQAVQAGAADDARRAAYEATKGKLRKAMADPTLQDELDDLAEVRFLFFCVCSFVCWTI